MQDTNFSRGFCNKKNDIKKKFNFFCKKKAQEGAWALK